MSEPVVKKGWLRALIFMPIWFLTMMVVVGGGTVLMMVLAGVDMQDPASVEGYAAGMESMDFASPMMLAMSLLQITASFAAIWFMMTVFNKEPLTNIGLSIKDRGQEMLAGLGAALLFIGGIFLILWCFGAITVTGAVGLKPGVMMVSLMLFVAAFDEEIVFRGYVLNNLMDSMNRWWALGVSSVVFALMHAGNPNVWSTFVPMTELFAAGFILGISYTFTKNLWFPTFFHFGWNFFQGLFGFEISGMGVDSWKAIAHENSGQVPDIISGGAFGIEGSVISLCCTILGTYLIYKYYTK
ncbi:MAG: CPBP family intramembrane glutamic endopeptidase [Candidatus Neomarinimicrobiota bacterium]|nr:CPBP family intramembrane glutamic endopeptidase [Candidatus Neomarinimicrobiota bacterium]